MLGYAQPVEPVVSGDKSPTAAPLTNRERFLAACTCRSVEYPPVWLMRQAGRALPEYRALKHKHSFLELVQTPELAAEVTLQPIRRFDFDAAILFSDILVVCEGLGQPYRFREQGGIEMEFLLKSAADIAKLSPSAVCDRLQYAAKALRLIKASLGEKTALIGFAGSPWTLANFMVEGGGVHEYTLAKRLFYSEPGLFEALMEKLAAAVTDFLRLQIDAGVDAVQIFDSLGGVLADGSFGAGSARWIKQIVTALEQRVPVIVFSRGAHGNWEELVSTGANVVSLDWSVSLSKVATQLPARVAVQGNLDPFLLATHPQAVRLETNRILREMGGRPGHIFNLGHGVPPDAKLENIEALVTTIRSFK